MRLRPLLCCLLTLAVLGGSGLGCRPELGAERNPVKLLLVPSGDHQATAGAAERLAAHLGAETNLHFSVKVPERYIDLVVAVGDRRADLLFMNDMSYLLANEQFGAQAVLAIVRGDQEDRYRGIILTHKQSGVTDVKQLGGKKIAYVDVHSVSGYIMPAMLLKAHGIAPAELVKAGSHERVVELVYRQEVDAGFTYTDKIDDAGGRPRDARSRVLKKHPDVLDQTVIIARTDPIPNEPIAFGEHVPESVRAPIVKALQSYIGTAEGRKVFAELGEITGLRPVSDKSYDPIRRALAGLGRKLDETVPGGGILELKRKERIEPVPPLGN